jgi:NTE family protein
MQRRFLETSAVAASSLFLAVMLLVLSAVAAACDDDDADGLDVALVLSGGGALATTHVGAIAVIEELGIPIHCVVGTSMGSVVGAFYAAGYDARELQAIFRNSEWPEAFAGQIARETAPYLRKEQNDLYLTGYLAGIGPNGVQLPAGFRSIAGLKSLYRGLLRHVPQSVDFDELTVPYRAVATDLASGRAVDLAEGDLVEAMLASMAVPGVFAPRMIEGRMLVDGGLAAQLPVSTAQQMGADLIIALDTTVEPPAPEPGWSVAQISQQLIRLTVWENWQVQRQRLGDGDVLLRPSLDGLTTASFDRA